MAEQNNADKNEIGCVDYDGDLMGGVTPHEAGRKRDQSHAQQQSVIDPEQYSIRSTNVTVLVMMTDPVCPSITKLIT